MDLAEVYGGPFETVNSFYYHYDQGLKKNPNGPAVRYVSRAFGKQIADNLHIAMHQPPEHLAELGGSNKERGQTECLCWSHSQLHLAALKVAIGLKAQGVQPNSTVAAMIPNSIEWAVLLMASSILPFTAALLDPGALVPTRSAELEQYLKVLRPSAIIVHSSHETRAADAAMQVTGVQVALRVVLGSDILEDNMHAWKRFSDIYAPEEPSSEEKSSYLEAAKEPNGDRLSYIIFTSGTSSGRPKGCPRNVGGTLFALQAQKHGVRLDTNNRFLHGTAPFRAAAPGFCSKAWFEGAAIVIPDYTSTPGQYLDAIEQHGITELVLIPAMMYGVINDPSFSSRRVDSVKTVIVGADMITKEILMVVQKAFPSADVRTVHGMTEGGGLFDWSFKGTPLSEIPFYGGISPLGKVNQGARLKVFDVDNQRTAKRNEIGELHVSSPSLITHYLENVDADAFYTDETGRWFKTGDSALINEDGVVYIVGRISDRFKRAGIPVSPAALESAISSFTGSMTSVFGLPHPILGAEPFAVVETFRGKSAADIKQHILDLFGSAFALGGVATLQDVGLEQFPLNATSKIVKRSLREHVIDYFEKNPELRASF